jgi:hypothetical protein
MKRNCLAIFIAVCVLGSFPGALECQCVDADCRFGVSAAPAPVPRCHQVPTHAKESDPKACCGKCRIEKTAVLESKFLPSHDSRFSKMPVASRIPAGIQRTIIQPVFEYQELCGSPPSFFEQHILNTTYSFRAPPLEVTF